MTALKWTLKVIETDDNFEAIADGYDYLVDFLDLSFPSERPDREHAYLEVRSEKKAAHVLLKRDEWLLQGHILRKTFALDLTCLLHKITV